MIKITTPEEFKKLQHAIMWAETDDEYKKLGFTGNTFTAYPDTKFSHEQKENVEIDLTSAPIYNLLYTEGKREGQPIKNKHYYKCFSMSNKDVSFYVPIKEKLFLDTSGTTRPTKTELHDMGGGCYFSDSMFIALNHNSQETIKNNKPIQLQLW